MPGKPSDHQNRVIILQAIWAKQSTDLHWPGSTDQCSVTSLGQILFSLPLANETIPLVCAIVCNTSEVLNFNLNFNLKAEKIILQGYHVSNHRMILKNPAYR